MRRSIVLAATALAAVAGLSSASSAGAQAPPPDPFMIVTPTSGPVGTVVTVSGNADFGPTAGICSEQLVNYIVTRSEFIEHDPNLTYDQDGNFTATVTIPAVYTSGFTGTTPPLTPGTVITFNLNCPQGPLTAEFTVTAPATTTTTSTTPQLPFVPPAEPPADAGDFTGPLPGTVPPGGTFTIDEGGFEPGEDVVVVLYSAPKIVTAVKADAEGRVLIAVALPADTPPGAHTVVLFSESKVIKAPLTVSALPGQAPAETLPRTGSSSSNAGSAGVGLALVAAGVATVALSRRRAARA